MASISSTGIGSGIDVGGLVSSLVAAEGSSKSGRLDRKEAEYTAKLSSLSTLKGAVSDFQSSYSSLKSISTFSALTATSSNNDVFTLSADDNAAPASYDIDVTQIATAQRLQTASGYADSNSTVIGEGTLTFAFASDLVTTHDVTITDGTLQGIRNAINDAEIGVSANVVFDGTDYELVITSDTGVDNELTITQTSTTGDLSAFEYDSTLVTGNLNQTAASADAIFTVDGVGVTSASNSVSDVIDDVTLELVGTGISESLTISQDTSVIGSAVQEFVDGYNSLMTSLNEASAYNEGGQNGILIGDSSVRGIVNQLRNILNTTVGDRDTEFNSFASIGILTSRSGTLEYDASKLTAAISSNLSEVQYLFAGGDATTTDANYEILGVPDNLAEGVYSVEFSQVVTNGSYSSPIIAVDGNTFDWAPLGDFSINVDGNVSNLLLINQDYRDDGMGGQLSLTASASAAAAGIETLINNDFIGQAVSSRVSVAFEFLTPATGHFVFTSNSTGSSSNVDIVNSVSTILVPYTPSNGTTKEVGVDAGGTDFIGGELATRDPNDSSIILGAGIFDGFRLRTFTNSPGGRDGITITDGVMDRLDILVSSFLDSDGIIDSKTDGLTSSIADITEQRTALNERLASYEARLLKQFNAMDTIVAQLNTTSSFLTNQLEGLKNLSTGGK